MRYLIYADKGIAQNVKTLLEEELQRFDVRASFHEPEGQEKIDFALFDAAIYITSRFKKINTSLPCFCLVLTAVENRMSLLASSGKCTVYTDLRKTNGENILFLGNPFLDVFKKLEIDHSTALDSRAKVVLVSGYNKHLRQVNIRRLQKFLDSNQQDIDVISVDLEEELESFATSLSNANIAIVTSWTAELSALYFNIPYIFYRRKRYLLRQLTSLQNLVRGKQIILETNKPEDIPAVLQVILHDHQRTASLLKEFQITKDLLGNYTSMRSIARDIIEKLED